MKKLGFVLLIFLNVYVVASDYNKKIAVGIGSLLIGGYLAKTTSEHNTLVLEAEIEERKFAGSCNRASGEDQEQYTVIMKTALTDYSQWYFRTYHELPYPIIPAHTNEAEISGFFQNDVLYFDKGVEPVLGAQRYATDILSSARQKATLRPYYVSGSFLTCGLGLNGFVLYNFLKNVLESR